MVKTDLNHAGMPERMLRQEIPGAKGALLRLIERLAPVSWFGHMPNDQYVVFKHKSDVPGWVWRARGLVVQPLYMERRGDLFAMNQWYFLGDNDCVSTLLSRSPVVKIANVAEFVPLHQEVPDNSTAARRAQVRLRQVRLRDRRRQADAAGRQSHAGRRCCLSDHSAHRRRLRRDCRRVVEVLALTPEPSCSSPSLRGNFRPMSVSTEPKKRRAWLAALLSLLLPGLGQLYNRQVRLALVLIILYLLLSAPVLWVIAAVPAEAVVPLSAGLWLVALPGLLFAIVQAAIVRGA